MTYATLYLMINSGGRYMKNLITVTILTLATLTGFQIPEVRAQSGVKLPDRFRSCVSYSDADSGVENFKNCSGDVDLDDYGSVFIEYLPKPVDPAKLSKAARISLLQALGSVFVGKTDSVVVTATIMLQRDMGAPVLLAKLPLASYVRKKGAGISVDQSATKVSGRMGPRYRLGGSAQILVSVEAIRNQGSNVKIFKTLAEIHDLLTAIQVIPTPSGKMTNAIAKAKGLDAGLSTLFGSPLNITQPIKMEYVGGSLMAARVNLELFPKLLPVGTLFVGLDRHSSILVDTVKAKPGGIWDFNTPDYSYGTTQKILSRYVADAPLKDRVAAKFTAQDQVDLAGDEATKFNVSCNKLVSILAETDINLGAADQVLAFWAYTAANGNLKNYAVRTQPCFRDREQSNSFGKYSLPLPPRPVLPPTAEQSQAISAAQGASVAAVNAEKAALHTAARAAVAAAQARKTPKPAEFDIVSWGGLFQYSGAKPVAGVSLLGEMLFLDAASTGKLYAGSHTLEVTQLVPNGEGVFRYSNKSPDQMKDYAGQVVAGRPHGFGVMTWTDRSVYRGAFANGVPEGPGVLTDAGGAKTMAAFSAGRAEGRGARESAGRGSEPGSWSGGAFSSSDAS